MRSLPQFLGPPRRAALAPHDSAKGVFQPWRRQTLARRPPALGITSS